MENTLPEIEQFEFWLKAEQYRINKLESYKK